MRTHRGVSAPRTSGSGAASEIRAPRNLALVLAPSAAGVVTGGLVRPLSEQSGGEAVTHCLEGLPHFHKLMTGDGQSTACLYAFDLIWLEAQDLRGVELIGRRRMLQKPLKKAGPALRFSEHMAASEGEAMFRHACGMGLEGIVSKRVTSRYKSGACLAWVKVKNPAYERRA